MTAAGPGRAALAAALALLASLLLPAAAAAHGGVTVLEQRDESYNVALLASELTTGGQPRVDLTAYLIGQRLGEPDLDAEVSIAIERDGEERTLRAPLVGDGYQVIVPEPERGAWKQWGFAVEAVGRDGRSRATADPLESRYSPPSWAIPSVAAAVALAALALILRRRSRRG
jgi:hypothetical protein